jgi:predicted permease
VRPDDHELDDEIRSHLDISVKERIERGEEPKAARLAALREFGYVPAVRDSMHRVWYSRWFDAVVALVQDMRVGLRSLLRSKGLALTVVVTLALGIGANAAIFSVVRGVLLRPLVNRDEDRLVYIRQSAPGIGQENSFFSVAEVNDLRAGTTTIGLFGEFSNIELTMVGVGEPRVVRAGVVNGSYFDVMGLRPVLGRLLGASDDGKGAAPAAVLSHRFWTNTFQSDPSIIGKSIQFGARTVTVVGVVEPSVPYPTDTEIIANLVTSPHHLGATMATERTHRMTELFGRLAPGVSVERARAELAAVHAAMLGEHPEAYTTRAGMQLSLTPLRDQITAPARTILLVLLAAAGVVFVIACSNVANLILARSVRREGELAVRAALGASHGALRRTLLAESLVLCGAGAILGLFLSQPLVTAVAQYAARFSVRALEVTVDATVLWVGAGLAMAAAILLAYVPRLPSSSGPAGLGLASGSIRITPGTNRRLRVFATAQIAFSFLLLAGAATLLASLIALQAVNTGYDTRRVLAVDVPPAAALASRSREVTRRIAELPGVHGVAIGSVVPWRDAGFMVPYQFTVEGFTPANGEEYPHARQRYVTPGFFAVLGVPIISGRDFTDDDRSTKENPRQPVVIVSQTLAQRLFPNGDALNRQLTWTDRFFVDMGQKQMPRRIIGIVADVDDENLVPGPVMTVYQPAFDFGGLSRRLFVHAAGNPYTLVPALTRVIREAVPEQPVERPATLEDVRAEALTPERLNTFVVSGFAGIAVLIAVVGVSGVLAFSVSARTREFGVRLAIGSAPRHILLRVLSEGAVIVTTGITAGVIGGYAFSRVAAGYLGTLETPGALPVVSAAVLLVGAALGASLMPAARASRVDVLQALRSE